MKLDLNIRRKTIKKQDNQNSSKKIRRASKPVHARIINPPQPKLLKQDDNNRIDISTIATANLDLEDLEHLSLEELKELEKSLVKTNKISNHKLKDKIEKLKLKKINPVELLKQRRDVKSNYNQQKTNYNTDSKNILQNKDDDNIGSLLNKSIYSYEPILLFEKIDENKIKNKNNNDYLLYLKNKFNLKTGIIFPSQLFVKLNIYINQNGEIYKNEIIDSSNHPYFESLIFDLIRANKKLKKPPKNLLKNRTLSIILDFNAG